MPMPLIEARGLSLQAEGRVLIADLNWQAGVGERWCVIGRNAVGKSTLLRALAGLSVPGRSGRVDWLGRDQAKWAIADAAAVRAFAPQQLADRFPIAVRRLLELAVCAPGGPAAGQVMESLDVETLAARDVMQLSGGERQRVALAQCAVQGAPLLLLDEPVAFQDPAHQLQVSRWLVSLSGKRLAAPSFLDPHGPASRMRAERNPALAEPSCSCLVVSAHDVNWIAGVATHVLALHGDGRWEAGPAAQMLDAARLEAVYGCRWRQADGAWLAVA
ncbi:MAG: ABC transporter ATP-binding protein [Burkholderiales bacterium]